MGFVEENDQLPGAWLSIRGVAFQKFLQAIESVKPIRRHALLRMAMLQQKTAEVL